MESRRVSKAIIPPVTEIKETGDDEQAFLQTQKALIEALNEQKILREKLTTLEARNRPAKWGKPIVIQTIDATRGKSENDGEMTPEQLISELKTAQHMLDNAKRASETARAEKRDLENEIEALKISAQEETENMLLLNAAHHKQDLQLEQQQFTVQQGSWAVEKSELLGEAEQLSMTSHDVLHKSSEAREAVEQQRKKIHALAAELRDDITKSKELRDTLDDAKTRVALIDNLIIEIDGNRRRAEELQKNVAEQKQILRAVRVSAQAKAVIDDIGKQTEELVAAKEAAEGQMEASKEELALMLETEEKLKAELAAAQEEFRNEQMSVFVMEAELRELNAEFERVKAMVIEEGRKNVGLQKSLREEKMDATMRYLLTHGNKIHRVDRVQSTLMNVKDQMATRQSSALPPLGARGKTKSALG